jgi:hypothetical protein
MQIQSWDMAFKVLSKKWPEARRDLEAALIDASK